MLFLISLTLSLVAQHNISTSSVISKSFYDLSYIEELRNFISSDCSLIKSTDSVVVFLNFKKNLFGRTEMASAILCMCEREKSYEHAVEVSKKSLSEILNYYGCNYMLFSYKGLKIRKKIENIEEDQKTLKDIIFKYFRR